MSLSMDLTISNLVFLGVILFIVKKLIGVFQTWRLEQMLKKYENSPKDKVVLHTVWRGKTVPSVSPYALKLETFLRMAKIPYELETEDPTGPKGKLPWITYNGFHVADSHLCIQFLNRKLKIDLNKNASEGQVAAARACRVLLEEHFLWGIVQFRWVENYSSITKLLKIPTLFQFLMPLQSWQIKKRMVDTGMGVHTPAEIYEMTEDDLRTVSTILGTKKFFGGDEQPCEEDCAIFGMLAQVVWAMPGSRFQRLVNDELKNLREYCERMKSLYWQDWDSCIDRS